MINFCQRKRIRRTDSCASVFCTYLTKRPVPLLVVAVVAECLAAVGAAEALQMEVLVERRDALV